MDWFESLTGTGESSPEQVRAELTVDGDAIVCPSGSRVRFGRFETPTLAQLRGRVRQANPPKGSLRLREVVGDVRQMHADPDNAAALFQVASQFNLLEMASPSVTPEAGIGIYQHDPTQGPACAISCGGGTIYRNYFVPVGDQIGQSANHQIDCASDLGVALGNDREQWWRMQNGYLFPTDQGLEHVSQRLRQADPVQLDDYRSVLRIGVQWDVEVTIPACDHNVSQAYCSALPVAYGRQPAELWAAFAGLVLQAAYESTICAAILNTIDTGCNKVFLTLLGGGVFGNRDRWITDAIERAVRAYDDLDLDVAIVSYGVSKPAVRELLSRY